MASKRDASKETTKRSIGEAFEKISVDLPMNVDSQLFIEKGTTLTWKHIKDIFAKYFEVDPEDQQVYVIIQQSRL